MYTFHFSFTHCLYFVTVLAMKYFFFIYTWNSAEFMHSVFKTTNKHDSFVCCQKRNSSDEWNLSALDPMYFWIRWRQFSKIDWTRRLEAKLHIFRKNHFNFKDPTRMAYHISFDMLLFYILEVVIVPVYHLFNSALLLPEAHFYIITRLISC